jgi:hypothetical protein
MELFGEKNQVLKISLHSPFKAKVSGKVVSNHLVCFILVTEKKYIQCL